MLLLGHIILKETPIYLVICLVTYNFNRWGFSVQPILRVFNTLKHIHTNTSTHLSATKIKMNKFKTIKKRHLFRCFFYFINSFPDLDFVLFLPLGYELVQIRSFYVLNRVFLGIVLFYPLPCLQTP